MADLVKRNHWVIRLTHWVNVVAVVIMAGSGMRIFNAHPAFARPGESFHSIRGKVTPFRHRSPLVPGSVVRVIGTSR